MVFSSTLPASLRRLALASKVPLSQAIVAQAVPLCFGQSFPRGQGLKYATSMQEMGSFITSHTFSFLGDLVGGPSLVFLLDVRRPSLDIARIGELGRLGSPINKLQKLVDGWAVLLLVRMLLPREFGLLIELHFDGYGKECL